MSISKDIDADLKAAMLAGDKTLATTLRGLKSTILYEEVAKGLRDTGLEDDAIIALLSKEAKKRQESADLYKKGGSEEKAEAELVEKKVIEKYLPAQMSDEELMLIVDEAISSTGASSMQQMGQVIGIVKSKAGVSADGSRIAQLVKEKLS
ncbi:GatB/YqeY domain-containing protein [Candidatus Saccharibacteria bacterium]|nr:GatB/YqeY domain-containing protein [Candidatus Saccharibacteria bacterium]